MTPMEILIEEHRLIRQALDNLSLAIEKLENEERPPVEFFKKWIELYHCFILDFHHFKEEHVDYRPLPGTRRWYFSVTNNPLTAFNSPHATDDNRKLYEDSLARSVSINNQGWVTDVVVYPAVFNQPISKLLVESYLCYEYLSID